MTTREQPPPESIPFVMTYTSLYVVLRDETDITLSIYKKDRIQIKAKRIARNNNLR